MVGDGASVGPGWELDFTPWFDGVFSCVIDPFFFSFPRAQKNTPSFRAFLNFFAYRSIVYPLPAQCTVFSLSGYVDRRQLG